MIKLIPILAIKQFLLFIVMTFTVSLGTVFANASGAEVAINVVLETAQAHAPGKIVAHEKAEEQVGKDGAKTLQPVYRVKVLSPQGVMKVLLIHRQTGLVIE
jgi:hypothetical protein